jgi:hypothetical protein
MDFFYKGYISYGIYQLDENILLFGDYTYSTLSDGRVPCFVKDYQLDSSFTLVQVLVNLVIRQQNLSRNLEKYK